MVLVWVRWLKFPEMFDKPVDMSSRDTIHDVVKRLKMLPDSKDKMKDTALIVRFKGRILYPFLKLVKMTEPSSEGNRLELFTGNFFLSQCKLVHSSAGPSQN